MRFLLEIIDNIRKKAGKDYTLSVRMSAEEFMEGGYTLEDTKRIASVLEAEGVDCLNIEAGWHESSIPLVQSSVPQGSFAYLAAGIKSVVKIPVVAAYRINSPLVADKILTEGKADLIGMCRALIADPELPEKAMEGRLEDIRPCIACCHCLTTAFLHEPLACGVNPRVGKEAEYIPRPATKPKKVFVVGGGPAGLEAARVAAERGHKVTLWENKDRLGGMLRVAAIPPYKEEIDDLANYLVRQVEGCGIYVRLSESLSRETVKREQPEVVVLATGASLLTPDIPGIDRENVVNAIDVLTGHRQAEGRVVIVGGGLVGCETADWLAQKGKSIVILEMLDRMANDMEPFTRWVTLAELRKAGVRMETQTKVVEITDNGVQVSRDGSTEFFEADTVIVAAGMEPNRELALELENTQFTLVSIGDCAQPRKIKQALEEGFRAGLEV